MTAPNFNPGFRILPFDVLGLIIGLLGALATLTRIEWAGLVTGFVVLHFFLFCNVFRVSRSAELIWATVFLALATSTIINAVPGWTATFTGSLARSTIVSWIETKRGDYHGILWKKLNPGMPEWWESYR